jgi:hypothetical protein
VGFFFLSNLSCSSSGDHQQENLAKFDLKKNMKIKTLLLLTHTFVSFIITINHLSLVSIFSTQTWNFSVLCTQPQVAK